ncbi:MAG: hypothetical protein RL040_96, partial [Bacteroidota bacterium]
MKAIIFPSLTRTKSFFFGLLTLCIAASCLVGCKPDEEDTINSSGNSGGGGGSGTTTGSTHSCGEVDIHNPTLSYGSVQDAEGNSYKTIAIGNQVWMAENLNTSVYRNGDPIENVTDVNEWLHSDTVETGAWCYYNNNGNAFECPYGKLYNYHAIKDDRGVCPVGWHIPSDSEWQQLVASIDPALVLTVMSQESAIAGAALTSAWNPSWWTKPETNSSGFSNIGGGARYSNGFQDFEDKIETPLGNYWSTSEIALFGTGYVLGTQISNVD